MSRARNVVVHLRAQVADFKRSMDEAAKAAEGVGSRSSKSTQTAATAFGQFGDVLNKNRDSLNEVANRALIVGGAMTAVTAIVGKTGIEYNTLQQTSRAALTTLLGGAEAANAQMDKLDDFARNSPFAKQVFINAQRQLIGFGYEAEQVLPILDAIQNAVAATGGNNNDIAELVRIFAQVRAAGKITAVDLMQFGQRGVDAAALIGDAMGKTGAQIREGITSGTLDADAAVQALTDGMQTRFGGAADNVKNTFAGSMDRVKAAIRDVSSEFASAFVDPQGGGLFVDWLNSLADLLRGFQALPDPVKNTAGAVFALSGVGLVATGSAIRLSTALLDTRESLLRISETAPKAAGAIRGLGTVTAAAAAALVLMEAYNQLGRQIDEWRNGAVKAHEDVVAEILAGDASLRGYGDAIASLNAEWSMAMRGTDDATFSLTKIRLGLEPLVPIMRLFNGGIRNSAEEIETFDAALADLVRRGAADQAAAALEAAGISAEQAAQALPQYQEALQGVANDETLAADAAQQHAAAMQEQAAAAEESAAQQRDLAAAVLAQTQAVLEAANSQIALEASYDRATEAIEKNGATLDITTEAGRNNASSLIDIAGAAVRAAEDQLKLGESTGDVQTAMMTAREEFIKVAMQMNGGNRAAAEALADEYGLTRGQVDELKRSMDEIPSEVESRIRVEISDAQSAVTRIKAGINSITGKTVYVNVVNREAGSVRASTQGGLTRATGGAIFGPGTETSDSILARLSNNEHVLSAAEVRGFGGHAGVERARALARMGALPAFASGGALGRAGLRPAGGLSIDYNRLASVLATLPRTEDNSTHFHGDVVTRDMRSARDQAASYKRMRRQT